MKWSFEREQQKTLRLIKNEDIRIQLSKWANYSKPKTTVNLVLECKTKRKVTKGSIRIDTTKKKKRGIPLPT